MINLCLNKNENSTLKCLIGLKLIKIRHDSIDKFGQETVYGRVELFFEDSIVMIQYDYEPYPLFGGDDDHPKFAIKPIDESEAVSALEDTMQIDIPIGQVLSGVVLVEDYAEVEWDGKRDAVKVLKAIILKFDEYEIALQGDYMMPLIDIIKGENVALKLLNPGDEFDNDPETVFKAERSFVEIVP